MDLAPSRRLQVGQTRTNQARDHRPQSGPPAPATWAGSVAGVGGSCRGLGRAPEHPPPPWHPSPGTPKAPLLGAAWHSPVRDTLGPFSLKARLGEVSRQEGSVWVWEEGPGWLHPLVPQQIPQILLPRQRPGGQGRPGLGPAARRARSPRERWLTLTLGWGPRLLCLASHLQPHLSGRSLPLWGLRAHLSLSKRRGPGRGHRASHRGRSLTLQEARRGRDRPAPSCSVSRDG